jgi:hypothetical protein
VRKSCQSSGDSIRDQTSEGQSILLESLWGFPRGRGSFPSTVVSIEKVQLGQC